MPYEEESLEIHGPQHECEDLYFTFNETQYEVIE